jgi:hypothetical protein
VSAEVDEHSEGPSTSKMAENVQESWNSSVKTVVEQPVSPQTALGSVMEFARRC